MSSCRFTATLHHKLRFTATNYDGFDIFRHPNGDLWCSAVAFRLGAKLRQLVVMTRMTQAEYTAPPLFFMRPFIQTTSSKHNFNCRILQNNTRRCTKSSLAHRCPSAGAIAWPRHTVDLLPRLARQSGVTLSPACVCVCCCMWSAVQTTVSCKVRPQQVELPWLQLACGVPTASGHRLLLYRLATHDLQSCNTVKATPS
jgi:hypothetical protein